MSRENCRYNKNARWTLEDAIKFLQKPKGRIKRMRRVKIKKITSQKEVVWAYNFWSDNKNFHFPITRWNRH